jgi:hypothetical protein
MNNDRPKAQK